MKGRLAVLFALGLLAAAPAHAYFDDTMVGARGAALGSGAIALMNDATAGYWNPAALANLRHAEGYADYSRLYDVPGLNVNAIGLAAPFMGAGWSLAWHRLSVADAYAEDLLSLAAGREILERGAHRVRLGATFKYGRIDIPSFEEAGSAVDLGAMAKGSLDAGVLWTTPWNVDFAWVSRDLLRPRYELTAGSGGDLLERRQELGAAIRWNRESTIAVGWAQPEEGSATINAGIEILFFDVFAIRSGIVNLSNVYRSLDSPNAMEFTGGFGVFHKGYFVDATATTHHELGVSYRASLRIPIGSQEPR